MAVIESGQDGLAHEVDDASLRPFESANRFILADGDDSAILDRDCLNNLEFFVHRDDVAVVQNQVSRLGRDKGAGRQQKNKKATHESSPGFISRSGEPD